MPWPDQTADAQTLHWFRRWSGCLPNVQTPLLLTVNAHKGTPPGDSSSRMILEQAWGQTLTRRTGLQSDDVKVSHSSVIAESGHCHHQAAGTFHECKADECSAVQQASLKPVEACRACRNAMRASFVFASF